MPPLRVFCIASTISPSFLRRKGAIIILLSLHQSNGHQPLFHNHKPWCFLLLFFFEKKKLWSKCLHVCFSCWFYHDLILSYMLICVAPNVCRVFCVICLSKCTFNNNSVISKMSLFDWMLYPFSSLFFVVGVLTN